MVMKKALLATVLAVFVGCGDSDGSWNVPNDGMAGRAGQSGGAGGRGGTPILPGPNVVDIVADSGPQGADYTNGLFAAATLCEPGTSNCQTIDHLLVDTGSVGVRVLENLLTISLPTANSASGEELAECTPFVDGTAWGPLRRADVSLGGYRANGLTVQAIGESSYAMPRDCTGSAITDFQTLGSNGILGVGIYLQDCGSACEQPPRSLANPGVYYACAGGQCAVASVPASRQVWHPVAAFPQDNNGVLIQLPSVVESGVASVSGQMVFGIGTQANNGLGDAMVLAYDRYHYVRTTFPVGGTGYASIIDSGSNGLFFLDEATSGIKRCSGNLQDFYCPASTTSMSATILAASGGESAVGFSVANTSRLSASAWVFPNLAGPMPGFPADPTLPAFDWGLPFFFGRTVYTAIENQPTPAGTGPYLAF
jgi:hypothetical protein